MIITYIFVGLRLLLWSLMPPSKIFQLNMWRSVLVVEETGVPGEKEKTKDLSQITDKLNHIMLHRVYLAICRIQSRNFRGDLHLLHR
jgi:hypothetical protein